MEKYFQNNTVQGPEKEVLCSVATSKLLKVKYNVSNQQAKEKKRGVCVSNRKWYILFPFVNLMSSACCGTQFRVIIATVRRQIIVTDSHTIALDLQKNC